MTTPLHDGFDQAYSGARGTVGETPSLTSASARWSLESEMAGTRPAASVLAQSTPSANGMSEQSAERVLPGMRSGGLAVEQPTSNAGSEQSSEQLQGERAAGNLPWVGTTNINTPRYDSGRYE